MRQEAALFVEGDVNDKDQRDLTNAGVVYNSVLTGSEQFTGSIAGDLSSVPNRASEGGRESLGKAHTFGTSVPSFNMNRTDWSSGEFTSVSTYDHMANCWRFGDVPLESFFKLRDKQCFISLRTSASFDTPEKIATWPRACVVHYWPINSHTATALLDSYTDCVLSLEKACMSCRIRTSIQLTRGCETIV